MKKEKSKRRPFLVAGHRGLPSRCPENTLISFEKALETGVDAIEFDVHLTRDGRLVVTHDDSVERCSNGKGAVRDFSFDEIRALDFGGWKGEEFKGTKIPTFEETLDLLLSMRGGNLEIWVEIKADDDDCTRMVIEELRRRGVVGQCVLLSFHSGQLVLARKIEPSLRLHGFRVRDLRNPPPDIHDLLMRVCLWNGTLSDEEIETLHGKNIMVDVCPVDREEELDQALKFDIDSFTSNAADVIMQILRERGLRQ